MSEAKLPERLTLGVSDKHYHECVADVPPREGSVGLVCVTQYATHAAEVIKRWNAHARLVAALKRTMDAIPGVIECCHRHSPSADHPKAEAALAEARAALAEIEE